MAANKVSTFFAFDFVNIKPLLFLTMVTLVVSLAANVVFMGKTTISQRKYITYSNSTAALNELLKEHLVLLVSTIKTVDTPESPAAVQALEENTTAIALWIGQQYGEPARYEFQNLWRSHIDAVLAYTRAAKKGDATEKATQLQKISAFPTALADLISKLNPQLDKAAVRSLTDLYTSRTKTIIDTVLVGEFVTVYQQQQDSLVVMNSLAEAIAKDQTGDKK